MSEDSAIRFPEPSRTMRILVTGGSGQLGQAIRRAVNPAVMTPTIFDNTIDERETEYVVQGDILDVGSLQEAMSGHDAVIHTAALHGKHLSLVEPKEFVRVNLQGTKNVLLAGVQAGVRRVVLMSSLSVHGLSSRRSHVRTAWVDEETRCEPHDINGSCKLECEKLAALVAERFGMSIVVLRSGRFSIHDEIDFNIAKLWGSVEVNNVAEAALKALTARLDAFEIFSIASETRFEKDDLPRLSIAAHQVIDERYPGSSAAVASLSRRLPVRLHRVIDTSKAKELLEYRPGANFDAFVDEVSGGYWTHRLGRH